MNTLKLMVAVVLVPALSACNAKPKENAAPATESAPAAQQAAPSSTTAESPAPSTAPSLQPTPLPSGDLIQSQPIDEKWAAQTSVAVEKALTARLTPEERALLGRIECRTDLCTVAVNANDDQIRSLRRALEGRVAEDLGLIPRPSGVVKMKDTKVNPPQTYFLLQFDRDKKGP